MSFSPAKMWSLPLSLGPMTGHSRSSLRRMSYFSQVLATAVSTAPVVRSKTGRGAPSGPRGEKTASKEWIWPPGPMTVSWAMKSSK